MPSAPAAHAAKEYSRLLLRLHDLIAEGKGDDEEAEAVRDEMDDPWYAMTERERERMAGLSEDLYSIAKNDVNPVPVSPKEKEAWIAGYRRAKETGEVDKLLELIRHPGLPVARELTRFTQAKCWENLGEPDVALRFFRDAQRQGPIYGTFILMLLMREDRWEEAVKEAKRIIAEEKSGPCELYMAALVLLIADHRAPESLKSKLEVEQAARTLERAIASTHAAPAWVQVYQRVTAIGSLGLAYARLGQRDRAIDLYTKELDRNTASPDLLILRGSLYGFVDKSAALRDFSQAASLGSKSVWPYYYLAHDALVRGDFIRCHDLALSAVSLKAWPRVLAQLHEWIGICRAVARYPEPRIWESFDQAEALDPGNDRIRRSRAIAESILTKPERLSEGHPWSYLCPEDYDAAMDAFFSLQTDAITQSPSEEESVQLAGV